MSRLFLTLFLLISVFRATAAQDWTVVPLGIEVTLRDIDGGFPDHYLVGDVGYVATSDGTLETWTPVNIGTVVDLLGVIRPASTEVWISGAGGIVRVRNVGGTWDMRDIPDALQDYVIFTRGSGQALVAGSGGSVWKSENAGEDWELQSSGVTTPLHDGIGGTSGDGFIVGDGGLILKTTDLGATWSPLPSGTTEDLFAVQYIAAGAVEVAGANGVILTSDDAGSTWTPRASGTPTTLRGLSTSGQDTNWHLAVGDDGVALRTTDNGETWCSMDVGVTTNFYAASMATNELYVAAGENGVMMRTETGSSDTCTVVANEPETPPVGYALSAIWPNPVRSEATLSFRVDEPQYVTVEVFDMLGRLIAEAFVGVATPGIVIPVRLDASRFVPGAYVVHVRGASFEESRRMIVTR